MEMTQEKTGFWRKFIGDKALERWYLPLLFLL